MPEKLTLTSYLEGRGKVKSLTRIEAEAFGVPYPLISGWPAEYGSIEITAAMLEDLEARIGTAKQSTASKARRGLDGATGATPAAAPALVAAKVLAAAMVPVAMPAPPAKTSAFPGFVVRQARRYRPRRSAPW